MNLAGVEGAGEVGGGFGVIFSRGAEPRPALIFTFDVDLFPEPLDLPVPVDVKVGDIDRAAAFLQVFHAVQAFSHESKVALVTWEAVAMPGAFECIGDLHGQAVLFRFFRVAINDISANFIDETPCRLGRQLLLCLI